MLRQSTPDIFWDCHNHPKAILVRHYILVKRFYNDFIETSQLCGYSNLRRTNQKKFYVGDIRTWSETIVVWKQAKNRFLASWLGEKFYIYKLNKDENHFAYTFLLKNNLYSHQQADISITPENIREKLPELLGKYNEI